MNIATRMTEWRRGGCTAKSYVRDGLFAMWDGIENAGWGVHDPHATVWRDLVGGYDADYWGTGTPTWDKNGIDMATNSPFDNRTLVQSVLGSPCVCDVEFVANPILDRNGYQGVTGKQGDGKKGIEALSREPSSAVVQIRLADNGVKLEVAKSAVCLGRIASYRSSFRGNEAGVAFYVNGAKIASQEFTVAAMSGVNYIGWCLGQSYGGAGRNMTGTINAVRIYNRTLTDGEIAANYAVDRKRFGI